MRRHLPRVLLLLSLLTAVASALAMRDRVRLVDIVVLFASGVASGASIVAALRHGRGVAERVDPRDRSRASPQ